MPALASAGMRLAGRHRARSLLAPAWRVLRPTAGLLPARVRGGNIHHPWSGNLHRPGARPGSAPVRWRRSRHAAQTRPGVHRRADKPDLRPSRGTPSRPGGRAERRLGARSPCGPGLGCRGTTRGTSADRIPVRCVLSGHWRVASAQVERPARPSSPLLIRWFRVRAPGAPPLTRDFTCLARTTAQSGLQLGSRLAPQHPADSLGGVGHYGWEDVA